MDVNRKVAKAAERCARHPYRVLAFALLLSILSGWALTDLPVYTSRQALLPANADVVKRLNSFLRQFGASSDLIVVLDGAPRGEMEDFAGELATMLAIEPEIGQVHARLDRGFFLDHAYLLAPAEWLSWLEGVGQNPTRRGKPNIERFLREASGWLQHPPAPTELSPQAAKSGLIAAGFFLDEWHRWIVQDSLPDAVDFYPLLSHFGAGELARGDFASRDGRMLFVFVHPKDSSEDFGVRTPFIEKVKMVLAATAARRQAAGHPPPHFGLAGLPAVEYEEYRDIQHDIVLVVASAVLFITLLILIVVRSFRWALAIFVPMAMGALWSQALVLYTVGHLTIITSGFIAILFGLGVDYGIFTSSRIAEERHAGKPLLEAIGCGIAASFSAVASAGGASLVIFGALATVDFPGFAELGVVAAGGVLLILLSTWMVQPALYALLPPRITPRSSSIGALPLRKTGSRPGLLPLPLALTLVLLALGGATAGIIGGLSIPFNYDAMSLLPRDSQALYYQRRMAAESDYQSEVVLFTAKDMVEARRITEEAKGLESIGKVQSLTELFPADAEGRSQTARRLAAGVINAGYREDIAELDRQGLSTKAFEQLRESLSEARETIENLQEQAFSAGKREWVGDLEQIRLKIDTLITDLRHDPGRARDRSEALLRALLQVFEHGLTVVEGWNIARPLDPAQIPASLKSRFFADDGTIAIYAFPAHSIYDPANLDHLMEQVYRVSGDATGFPATSAAFSKMAVRSFGQGTVRAVAVCLVWLLVVLRSWRGFVLASLPLLIGGGWMLGLMAVAGIDYNYANIIALPLVIALAVDYGVWFSHRWRELDRLSPLQVTVIAGKVIALAAGTELAGLGAITLAKYRGISTMGVNITIGLLCCLAATLIVAPAIGQLIEPRRTSS